MKVEPGAAILMQNYSSIMASEEASPVSGGPTRASDEPPTHFELRPTVSEILEHHLETWRQIEKSRSVVAIGRPNTDIGNAELFCDLFAGLVAFPAWKEYLIYTGQRWAPDQRNTLPTLVGLALRNVAAIVALCETIGKDEKEKRLSWLAKSETALRVKGAMQFICSDPRIVKTPDAFDRDPFAFNCASGVIDLRTGGIRAHCAEDFFLHYSPVKYTPEADAPRFMEFIDEVTCNRNELIQWLLGFHGLALTGDVSAQLFPIYAGSRGKTTFLQVVEYLMGSYYKAISAATLLEQNSRGDGPRSDLADLKGVRLAVAVEPESGARLSVGLVKQLTGGDTITCRRLYGQPFSYRPSSKFILLCNHKPRIPQMDTGIARRLRVIPFELDLPLDRQDPILIDKLLSEGPGILAALVRACVSWYRAGRGAGALPPCRSIEEATNEYKIAEDQIARFLFERCEFGGGRFAKGGDLCRTYTAWCESTGERPASTRTLSERLVEMGFLRKHTEAGAVYTGLSVKGLIPDGN